MAHVMYPDLLVRAEVEDGCINTSRRSHDTGRNDNRSSLRNASPYVALEPRHVGPMRFAGKRAISLVLGSLVISQKKRGLTTQSFHF